MNPLLSIVIANYNYGRFLEAAIKSVVEQVIGDEGGGMRDKVELIICDAASTDNSVDIIKKYAAGLPPNTHRSEWQPPSPIPDSSSLIPHPPSLITWWCSEKDKGQSDAFNKGFAHARGRLGCWVNADDLLLPGTIKAVIDYVELHPEVEWITGGTIYFDENLKIWRARIGTGITKRMHKWVDATVIGGPSSFFSIERLRRVGGFDISLHYTMDGDLWNKFFVSGMQMVHLPRYFWGFRAHDASKTSHAFSGAQTQAFHDEDKRVFRRKNYSPMETRIRVLGLKIHKILTGCALRSYLDTKKFRGRNVIDEFGSKERSICGQHE